MATGRTSAVQRQPAAELCVRSSSTPALPARVFSPAGKESCLGQFWVDVPAALSPFLYHYRRPSVGGRELSSCRTSRSSPGLPALCGQWLLCLCCLYCGPCAALGAAAGSLQVVWCGVVCAGRALACDNLQQACLAGQSVMLYESLPGLCAGATAGACCCSSHSAGAMVSSHTPAWLPFWCLVEGYVCGPERLLVFLLWCCTGCTCAVLHQCAAAVHACQQRLSMHICCLLGKRCGLSRLLDGLCHRYAFFKTMNALLSLLHKRVCLLACTA